MWIEIWLAGRIEAVLARRELDDLLANPRQQAEKGRRRGAGWEEGEGRGKAQHLKGGKKCRSSSLLCCFTCDLLCLLFYVLLVVEMSWIVAFVIDLIDRGTQMKLGR